jgi:glycosyltransferase involved in cell wall biosynthesis
MKVLALASYPIEAAATRYRLHQFIAPLADRGIFLSVHPFLDSQLFASFYNREQWPRTALGVARSTLKRLIDVWQAREADVILVQREAMMFGPPILEWLITRARGRPLVLDLDDATYVRYTSPTYGQVGSALKWFSKTDDLINWAQVVTCGNRSIAEYVTNKGARAVIIPTIVDTEKFRPAQRYREEAEQRAPILGWIGTHSTYPFLESLFPVLQQLAHEHPFRLKIVGAGRDVLLPGIAIENLEWKLEREIADFQSFDVGLYPVIADNWSVGKSGFKAIQYMAVGIPYVTTPVGACAEIGVPDVTHFLASSPDEWRTALARLLRDATLRQQMGDAGRTHALQYYTVPAQADKLAGVLREAGEAKSR